MSTGTTNWQLINEATRDLTGRGCTPFTRIQVYEEIWRRHPDRQRGSLDPTFQGMVANASGGPTSAGGTPLRRVERGLYVRSAAAPTPLPPREESVGTSIEPPTKADVDRAPVHDGDSLDWLSVWQRTGATVAAHVSAGRGHLMTEDTLRFAAILALGREGIEPAAITIELPDPRLAGGKLDMVVDMGSGDRAVVEFKFPRDARGPISPDTMTLGELLRDFHRVSRVDAQQRWVIQLLGLRLLRYLERVAERHPLTWISEVGQAFSTDGAVISGLPKTARDSLHTWGEEHRVVAQCAYAQAITDDLRLIAYCVEPG